MQLFFRQLKRNILWLLLLPAITVGTVYYFTQNSPKVYRSTATVYTGLASGYSILSDERNGWVSSEAVNNEFDNLFTTINSQETLLRVGTHLLAKHLNLSGYDSLVIGRHGYQQLGKIKAQLGKYVVAGMGETATFLQLNELAHAKGINPVKELILRGNSYYSIGRIKEVKTVRKSGSDMLLMEYQSDDPAVTQATLALLIDVFRERYADFKSSEANSVVKYYSDQTHNAQQSLQQAESKLKSFGVTNKIIDYSQQSITAATSKAALTDDYNKEMMQYQAAKAALATLEKRVSDRGTTLANNEAFISKREEIVKVQSQLANARSYGQPKSVVANLETRLARLMSDMKQVATQHYDLGSTTESLAQRSLLDEWLKRLLTYEESAARLGVYEKQIKELENTTTQLTPLGSTLKQLNRDVDVAEKQYIENLAELNKARARQKNAEMEGPLSVLDAPDFPLSPLPSKRNMLLGAGFATGFVLAFLLMLVRYLLDNRINSPKQAEALTGMSMAAVFPTVGRRSAKAKRVVQAMLEQLRTTIAIELQDQNSVLPYTLIVLISNRPQQGKSWLGTQLADQYGRAGHSVLYSYPSQSNVAITTGIPSVTPVPYSVGSDFVDIADVDTLVKRAVDPTTFDVVLVELPSLVDHAVPARLVAKTNVSVLIVNARSTWTHDDEKRITLYKRATKHALIAVLNQADLDMIGIIPSVQAVRNNQNLVEDTADVSLAKQLKPA